MTLIFAFTVTVLFVLVLELWMRGFEGESVDNPRDSVPTSILATLLWVGLLAPLFFSYA